MREGKTNIEGEEKRREKKTVRAKSAMNFLISKRESGNVGVSGDVLPMTIRRRKDGLAQSTKTRTHKHIHTTSTVVDNRSEAARRLVEKLISRRVHCDPQPHPPPLRASVDR